jgi:hypothetical protein
VVLPALTAAKFETYRAMRAAGLSKRHLAERLGWQPSHLTRLFDGRHASHLDQIEAALNAFGRRLVVTSVNCLSSPRGKSMPNVCSGTALYCSFDESWMSICPRVQEGYSRSEKNLLLCGSRRRGHRGPAVDVVEQGLSQPATAAGRRRASLGRRSAPS